MRKELTDKVIGGFHFFSNFVSALFRPFEDSYIDDNSGNVTHDKLVEKGNVEQTKSYGLRHSFKLYGVILRETFLHPTKTSYINPVTLEVSRE